MFRFRSVTMRAVATLCAAVLVFPSVAEGSKAMAEAAWELVPKKPPQAAHFSAKPVPPVVKGRAWRDESRSLWWTPRALNDLKRIRFERAVEQGRVPLFASIDPSAAFAVFNELGGDEGRGGDPLPGEGGDPGGTTGGGGSTGGDGRGRDDGGLRGESNSATGNKLTELPIAGWSSLGQSGTLFGIVHNSTLETSTVLGPGWRHSYEAELDHTPGSTAIVTMPDGLIVPYTESAPGTFTRPAGWTAELVRIAGGQWEMRFKNRSVWRFDASGLLSQVRDKNGNAVTIGRDASNRVASVTCPSGRVLTLSYNAGGKLNQVTDPAGRVWTFTYSGFTGDLLSVNYPALNGTVHSRSFSYNASHDILTHTDLTGAVWSWTYDANDRVTSASDPLGNTTTTTYGSGATTFGLPGGGTVVHNYTGGLLSSEVDPASFSVSYTYDAQRNVLTKTDQGGGVWTFTYDARGNVLTATNPLNQTSTYMYSAQNDLLTATTPLGRTTTYAYDGSGNLLTVTDPLGTTAVTNAYDGFGQRTSSSDALGRTTSTAYDSHGNATSVTDPGGITTSLAYDILGRSTSATNALGQTTSVSYDAWGRATSVTHPGGASASTVYDLEGRVLFATDELGNSTGFLYNAAGWLVKKTDARGDEENYAYNAKGWVTAVTNGNGHTRAYTHTARGEVASLTLPDGAVEQWTYRPTGEVSAYTSPIGYQVSYSHNSAGDMTGVDYPAGTADVALTYDADGRRTSMTDGTGASTWTFDAASRLTSLVQPQGTTSYAYNLAGQRVSMTEPSGTTTYSYDATSGRLLSLTNPVGETTSFLYDALGRVSRKNLHGGQYETYAYDNRGRLTGVEVRNSGNTLLRSQSYAYDAASRMLSHTVDGVATSYTHDAVGRLLTEVKPGYSASYTYDAQGNRLTRTVNGTTETYAYDGGDKLLSVSVGGTVVKSYAYDAAGRTTSVTSGGGVTTLAYDHESRVTSISGPGVSASYTYNGLDTRVSSLENSVSRTFHRDGAYVTDPVLSDGAATYTPGVSERRGGTTTYSHAGLKSFDSQSNAAQAVTGTRGYDAFGNVLSFSGSWRGSFGHAGPFGYQESSATGLQLLGHRYYDPSTGRFLTRDPIKDGRNWYAYCDNSPLTFADFDGLTRVYILYQIVNGSGDIMKYGITSQGRRRYREWWYKLHKYDMEDITKQHLDGIEPSDKRKFLDKERELIESAGEGELPLNNEPWSPNKRFKKPEEPQGLLGLFLSFLNPFSTIADVSDIASSAIDPHVQEAARGYRYQRIDRWLND